MFYLKEILDKNVDTRHAIITILEARGFLIDIEDEHFYLSDNASFNDFIYLSKGLEKYELGYVVDNQNYIQSSRKNWNKDVYSTDSCLYKSLGSKQVEIIIDENANIDNMYDFFCECERIMIVSVFLEMTWNQFLIEELGDKPDVNWLESYVAFYVKAISACGVYTSFSCDGNHNGGKKIYIKSDYPSNIWHFYIWKNIVCKKFGDVSFIEDGIEFSDDKSKKVHIN